MFKKHIYIPIIAVMLMTFFPLNAHAAQFESGDYTLDAQSVVKDDLYITGNSADIKGVVDGDLIVFGQSITVDGTVSGDLYAFGSDITITGNVYGNVVALGSNVNVKGTIGSNAYLGGMMVDINADLAKDLNTAAGTAKLAGNIGDDVRVAAGQLSSEATVSGDFLASSNSPVINKDKIAGQFILSSQNQSKDKQRSQIRMRNQTGFNIGLSLIGFVGMYLVGLLLIYTAPVKTASIGKKVSSNFNEFIKSFAIGLLILLALPVPIFILTMTLVGAPLAILLTAILVFLVTFGTLWTETAIGFKVLSIFKYKDDKRLLSLLTGRVITAVIRLLPFIGAIYTMILSTTTVGAVFRAKYDTFKIATSKK